MTKKRLTGSELVLKTGLTTPVLYLFGKNILTKATNFKLFLLSLKINLIFNLKIKVIRLRDQIRCRRSQVNTVFK